MVIQFPLPYAPAYFTSCLITLLILSASCELHSDECADIAAVNLLQTTLNLQSATSIRQTPNWPNHVHKHKYHKLNTEHHVRGFTKRARFDIDKYHINPKTHWKHGSNLLCRDESLNEDTMSKGSPLSITFHIVQFILPMLGIAFFISYRDYFKAFSAEASSATGLVESPTFESTCRETSPDGILVGPPLGDLFAAGSITALFDKQVKEHPDALAVVDAQTSYTITYADLDHKVDALATALHRTSLKEGDVVALLLQTSVPLLVSALAAMRAKVIWVPLDELAPAARLKLQVECCGARLGIACEDSATKDIIVSILPTCFLNSRGVMALDASPSLAPTHGSHPVPRDIAAMIFTSGSTGVPKAVMYGQSTFLHGVVSCVDLCQMGSCTRLLVKTPSVWAVIEYELFSALVVGGTAVIDPSCQRDIQRLSKVVVEQEVSAIVTSAPVLQLLSSELQGKQHELRDVINVGAAMPTDVCIDAVEGLGPQVRVHNLYGCTETPCTQWTYSPTRNKSVALPKLAPAGRPQPGCDVYLLDADLRPVPHGQLGEICFGGAFLSPGYYQDLEQTTKRFLPNPHGQGKMYRSGDLGRFVLDPVSSSSSSPWVLQVEGRKDRQLNINGVRVAPEEVETLISKAPGVAESAVVQAGQGESSRMVACISGVAQHDGVKLDKSVDDYCKGNLAKHMRPSVIIVLPKLPKLSNGKVDLKALESIANDTSEEETAVLDSLGLMRSMSKTHLKQKRITDNLVAFSVIAMVFYHTCQTAGSCYSIHYHEHVGSFAQSDTMYWFLIKWREPSEWSSYGFVIGGALMDAVDPFRFKAGVREVVISFAYILGCVVHRVVAWEWGGLSFWYLPMLLIAKTVIVTSHRFQIPRFIQLLIFMSFLSLGNLAKLFDDICGDADHDGIAYPESGLLCEFQGTIFGVKSLLRMGKTCTLVVYGFTFLYGSDLVTPISFLRRYAPSSLLSILGATCSFLVFACVILFYSDVSVIYYKVFGRLTAVFVLMPLLLTLLLLPEGCHLEYAARNALGSYVSSCIFYGTFLWKEQTFFWLWLGSVGGSFLQVLAMIVIVVAWVYLIGPGTQMLLLAPIRFAMDTMDRLKAWKKQSK